MAETTIGLSSKDVTMTLEDDTGTALTYPVRLTEGQVTLMQGGYNSEIETDVNGVPLSGSAPRQAGVESFCGVRFSCRVQDIGDNSTDEVLLDILNWDGNVGANWVSTTSSPDSTMKTVDVVFLVADRGSVKGATIVIPDVLVSSLSHSLTFQRGFALLDNIELRSTTTVKYTETRTAA